MEKGDGKKKEIGTGKEGKVEKKWEIIKKKDIPDYSLYRHPDDDFLDRIHLMNVNSN